MYSQISDFSLLQIVHLFRNRHHFRLGSPLTSYLQIPFVSQVFPCPTRNLPCATFPVFWQHFQILCFPLQGFPPIHSHVFPVHLVHCQIPQHFRSLSTSDHSPLQVPHHFRSLITSDPWPLQFPHIFSSLTSSDTSPL